MLMSCIAAHEAWLCCSSRSVVLSTADVLCSSSRGVALSTVPVLCCSSRGVALSTVPVLCCSSRDVALSTADVLCCSSRGVALSTAAVCVLGSDATVVSDLAPQQVRARGALRRLGARHRCYGHQQVSTHYCLLFENCSSILRILYVIECLCSCRCA